MDGIYCATHHAYFHIKVLLSDILVTLFTDVILFLLYTIFLAS